MLLLLPLWLALFAMLVGWGLLTLWLLERASRKVVIGTLTTFQTVWLGYAALVAFVVWLSLVLPIARVALVLAIVPAIAGFVVQRRAVGRRLLGWRTRPRMLAVLACVGLVATFAAAYACCDKVTAYDTHLYHLQVVKWIARYRAVPGLANLHLRFGYDNSIFVFGALVDAFWQGVAVHAMNGFLMAAVLCHWSVEIFTARTPRGRVRQTYCLLTLPLLLAKLWYVEVASFSSDLPLAILCLVLVLELVSLPRGARERLLLPTVLVLVLGAVATTTKLPGLAPFAVAAVACAWLVGRGVSRRTWLVVLAPAVLLLVGWVVRNVIISGWLVFPVFGKLPLAWSVPADAAADHLRWIESWARLPQQDPSAVLDHGFLNWFVPWFDGFRQTKEMVLVAASGALLAWRAANPPARSALRVAGERAAIAACVLGMMQWFVGAPDLRFGGFLFWALPAVVLTSLIAGAMRDATVRALVLTLSLALCAWNGGLTPHLNATVPKLWDRPPSQKPPPLTWRQTGPQTLVSYPVSGDQCGDAELPCTPNPNTQTFRDPDSLSAGFYPAPPS